MLIIDLKAFNAPTMKEDKTLMTIAIPIAVIEDITPALTTK